LPGKGFWPHRTERRPISSFIGWSVLVSVFFTASGVIAYAMIIAASPCKNIT